MSFREKRAWIELLSVAAVYGVYFFLFGRAILAARGASFGFLAPVTGAIIALIVIQTILTIAASASAPSEARAPYDERDRLIDLAASRAGFCVVQAGVFVAIAALALGCSVAVTINGLLAVMVAGELAKSGAQVIGYRRSAA
ncbi:MAG: hypothetical protein ACREEB_02500 [Caulobacteraceae bacterium]